MQTYNQVSIAAPAQIANIFGFFDSGGFLCVSPPLNDHIRSGGTGDVITVEFGAEQASAITVEYLVRKCDTAGAWEDTEPFPDLAEDVKKHPERDIIRIVSRNTIQAITKVAPSAELLARRSINISVVKCLPAGKVGVGLGSSASSSAVAIAIDRLFGEVLRTNEEQSKKKVGHDSNIRLRLMGEGEQLVSGATFYDNVAPLLYGGLVFVVNRYDKLEINSLNWPRELHVATVTPDLSLETRLMREVIKGRNVSIFEVADEVRRRCEVMIGLTNNDVERIIHCCNKNVIEDVRWPLISGSKRLLDHIAQRRQIGFNVSLGISGSGPTVYILADSRSVVNQMGEELHEIWKSEGIRSWWFLQECNLNGIDVFECR